MIAFEIKPFVSVNDYKLGLTRSAIAKKNGKPFKIEIDNIMEETREYREGIQLTFIKNKLVDIIVKKDEEPVFNGIDIFHDDQAFGKLQEYSKVIKSKNNSYCLFTDLGICVGGLLGKRVPEGKILTAFSEDRMSFYEIFLDM